MSDARTATRPPEEPAPGSDVGPPVLLVTMGRHRIATLKAPLYSLTRHENERGEGFGVLAIALANGMSLYFEHDAASCRELAAACLACADKLDGGRGKQ